VRGSGFGIVLLSEACFCRVGARLSDDGALGQPGDLVSILNTVTR